MNIISTDTEAQSKNFNGVYHKWIFMMFHSPIFRPYESKGALDTYADEEEE